MKNTNINIDFSKIRMPDISGTVSRPRLFKRLDKNKHKNLIFITGQAAQGKSTLAASFLHDYQAECAWINVSAEDSNPVTLFHALIFSIENSVQGIDLSSLKDYPAMSVGPREEAGLYRDWVCAIFAHLSFPLHIVFDGIDRLAYDAPSNLFLKVCYEEVAPDIHFWFISRTGEPFNIEEIKMNPKGFIIENKELSFTKNEIKKYFRKFNQINLNADHLARVLRFTEGWVGGLILISDAIDRIPEDNRDDYLFSEISSQFRMEAFQYFGAEILTSLPRSTQRFLIVSSVFETVDPELMGDLYKELNCKEILAKLVQKNLFVHSIHDERDGWLFRYHQLFRDYLLSLFNSNFDEDERSAILYQAGLLCESHGKMENAAHFYIRCGRYQNAVNVIETIGTDLLKIGRTTDLSSLIQALPENQIKYNPWLLLYLSATRRFTGADENTHSLQTALELFKQREDVRGQILTLAFLIESSTYRGRDITPLGILLEEAETLLHASPIESYPWESAILWHQVGFGLALRGGDQRKSYQACQNAYLLSRTIGNRPLQVAALAGALLPLAVMGEFTLAENLAQKALSILNKGPYPELRAWYLVNYSQACTVKGELTSARDCAVEAREISETHGLLYLYPVALLSELMIRPQMGEFLEGEETGRHLLEFAEAFGMEFLSSVASMFMGLSHYIKHDYEVARRYLEISCCIASADDTYSDTHISWNKILMGLVCFHQKKTAKAEILLNEALDHFTELASSLTLVVVHWALAFINYDQNKHVQAVHHLKTGINIARDNAFYHLFFMNQEDILKVGLLCVEYDLKETESYVSKFLAMRLAGSAIDKLLRYIDQSKTKSSLAYNIVGYIHRSNLPMIRVATLNGFRVYRDGYRIKDDEWGGSLPQSLLKAIITRGCRQVPKERVIEDLWPGATRSSSETNFKVNLHRLRKLMEPSMLKELGSSYIQLKGNLITLDKELCEIDVLKFSELRNRAIAAKSQGHTKTAIECLAEAVKLYKDDYLAEDLYNDTIGLKRDKLCRQYADCLFELAGLHEMKGSLKKAEDLYKKLITFDPLSEAAHQKLMINFSNRGKTSDAIKIYQKLKKVLRMELDADPGDVTRSIYEKILDKN